MPRIWRLIGSEKVRSQLAKMGKVLCEMVHQKYLKVGLRVKHSERLLGYEFSYLPGLDSNFLSKRRSTVGVESQ